MIRIILITLAFLISLGAAWLIESGEREGAMLFFFSFFLVGMAVGITMCKGSPMDENRKLLVW